jgi:hypothetical protein
MSLTSEVTALLNADTAFKAALTAGAFDAVEITRQLTPGAFDTNSELKPCALVKTGNENALQNKIGAVQTTLTIYFYQRSGFTAIDTGLARALALLNLKHSSNIWEIQFNNEIARTTDEALACSLAVQRYNVIRKR